MKDRLTDSLVLIPARGGSKGIPGKNIRLLAEKPLILYSIESARKLLADEYICLSTDTDEIISVANNYQLAVPFKRPQELAQDNSSTEDVIRHAIGYYKSKGRTFKYIILLQPTSPLRTSNDILAAYNLITEEDDMVVSVSQCKTSPFYNLFEEDSQGFLKKTFDIYYSQRQELQKEYFQFNGAIYIIRAEALKEKKMAAFTKIKKYVMDPVNSVDIDTPEDWKYAEFLMKDRDAKNNALKTSL